MTLSVLIVNYNTAELLERCLKSVYQTESAFTLEVLVADCNSTDGSVQIIKEKFPSVGLRRYSTNVGFTRPVNRLLEAAKGDYYLLLHPDVELMPDTVQRLLGFLESNPQVGLAGANLYYPDGTPNACEILFPSFHNDFVCFLLRLARKFPGGNRLAGDYNPLEWSHHSTARVNWVWNACMMLRKAVFEDIGGFDEDFFVWYADWDFCKRAGDIGWESYYLHPARAIHHESQSFEPSDLPMEAVRYKIDGWQSAARMITDRYTFVKKHSPASLPGIKVIDALQNTFRFGLLVGRSVQEGSSFSDVSLSVRAYKKILRAILR